MDDDCRRDPDVYYLPQLEWCVVLQLSKEAMRPPAMRSGRLDAASRSSISFMLDEDGSVRISDQRCTGDSKETKFASSISSGNTRTLAPGVPASAIRIARATISAAFVGSCKTHTPLAKSEN